VLLRDGRLDEIDRLALDRAAIAISMRLLSQGYADAVLDQVGGDLIGDLMAGAAFSEQDVLDRARALGCDLSGRRLVALAVDADGFSQEVRARGLEEDDVRRLKLSMLKAVRRAVADAGCRGIAAVASDGVLGVVAVPPERDPTETLDDVGGRARREILAGTGLGVTVGASREAGSVLALSRAFSEAREALAYGKEGPDQPVHHFGRLGLDTLIVRLRGSVELPQFVESELGPLLEHDARRRPELLPTLQTFLDRGGNKSATAKALHLERRSLYHRLDKIADLLGRDLDDPETRTRLHVALRALAILRRGEPAAGAAPSSR
jgi:purine catabolism regulator